MDEEARRGIEARLREAIAPCVEARERAAREEDLDGIEAALATEEDVLRRVALEERRLDVVARRLSAPAAEAIDRVRAEARALGWPSARALVGAVRGIDLGALAAEAEALLRATGAPDLGAGVLARHDLPRARRTAEAQALALLDTRLDAARLLHDLDLLDEGPHPALRERYARRMAAATGLTWPSAPWLDDADPLLSRACARPRP